MVQRIGGSGFLEPKILFFFSWVESKQHNKRSGNPIISVQCMKLVFFVFVSNLIHSDCAKNYKLRVFLRNVTSILLFSIDSDAIPRRIMASYSTVSLLCVWRTL